MMSSGRRTEANIDLSAGLEKAEEGGDEEEEEEKASVLAR